VREFDQSRGLRGEAAESDGLCITCMVTQHMLRIDNRLTVIYIQYLSSRVMFSQ
jgi:hypothetical protein